MGAPGFDLWPVCKNTRAPRKRGVRGGKIRNVFTATAARSDPGASVK